MLQNVDASCSQYPGLFFIIYFSFLLQDNPPILCMIIFSLFSYSMFLVYVNFHIGTLIKLSCYKLAAIHFTA